VHNIQLAKLWHAKRCLLVEGKDVKILAELYDVLFPDSQDGLGAFPSVSIGGWGGWQRAVGSSLLLKNAGGEAITAYCILDSDYHSEPTIDARFSEATEHGVELHIWGRKEIENYLLVPSAIRRVIARRGPRRVDVPTETEIADQLDAIAEDMKEQTFDALSGDIQAATRSLSAGAANRKARAIIEDVWISPPDKLRVVSGRDAFARLSDWAQNQFGVTVTPIGVARCLLAQEIPAEMKGVLSAIHDGVPLDDIRGLRRPH
jgi:hypothetical protein